MPDRDHDDRRHDQTASSGQYGVWHAVADVIIAIPELAGWVLVGLFRIVAAICVAVAGS